VFVKCAKETGFPDLGFSGQGDKPALLGRRQRREERIQPAGPKDGSLVYTEWDLEVQNGDSGPKRKFWLIHDGLS
jgi:hypothetical protein